MGEAECPYSPPRSLERASEAVHRRQTGLAVFYIAWPPRSDRPLWRVTRFGAFGAALWSDRTPESGHTSLLYKHIGSEREVHHRRSKAGAAWTTRS